MNFPVTGKVTNFCTFMTTSLATLALFSNFKGF